MDTYTRHINGGGLTIWQLVFFSLVFSYSNNKSASNGKVGRRFQVQRRINTAL